MNQDTAISLMDGFARRTGLSTRSEHQRYLWTDAFAVVNYLELYRRTGDEQFASLARALIEQVHSVLGRHRGDDGRSGWLSGLSEVDGDMHPTLGGLRIGKPLPERGLGAPVDERLEWERDGQYFHYLTKWMDALARASLLLHHMAYLSNAAELAKAVLPGFLQRSRSGNPIGIAWKMSIDLSRPQVSGMSPHDALDGYITFKWLRECNCEPALDAEVSILQTLAEGGEWTTSDALGIGGLLLDAMRLAILPRRSQGDETLIGRILSGTSMGLGEFLRQGTLGRHPERRLAFRELGLAIGLQGVGVIASVFEAWANLSALHQASSTASQIVDFWSEPRYHSSVAWQDNRNINEVMLATALLKAQVGTIP